MSTSSIGGLFATVSIVLLVLAFGGPDVVNTVVDAFGTVVDGYCSAGSVC